MQLEPVIAPSDIIPANIICSGAHEGYDGCGFKNCYDNDMCSKCSRLLKTIETNSEGKVLYLDQSIYFLRNDGVSEPGTIVNIIDDDGTIKVVCKYKKNFTSKAFDLTLLVDQVFVTMEALTHSLGSRKRNYTAKYVPEPVHSQKTKKSKTNASATSKVEKLKTSSHSSSQRIPAKPKASSSKSQSNKVAKCRSPSSSPASAKNGSKNNKRKAINCSSNDDIMKSEGQGATRKKTRKPVVIVDNTPPLDYEEFCTNKLEQVAPTCDLNPSEDISGEFHGRYLDKYIKKGLLHVLWNWAVPDRRQEETEALGPRAWKPEVTVKEIQEIIKYCPVSITQMMKLQCRRLLYISPAINSEGEVLPSTNTANSVGGEIIDCIRGYLIERTRYDENLEYTSNPQHFLALLKDDSDMEESKYSLSIEELQALKLCLPLPYYYFRSVMNHVYNKFGGSREILEKLSEIKGVKEVVSARGKQQAMYGSMTETFTEEMVIQHTRLGKSNVFVDIGHGIGQINIQVAATTLARTIGVELEDARFNVSVSLLKEFDEVLEAIGVKDRITPLVNFIHGDMLANESIPAIRKSDIIFFDNYGGWFANTQNAFCKEIVQKTKDCTQIICVNPLVAANAYCLIEELTSSVDACSWMASQKLKLHRYVRNGDKWTCRNCTFQNSLDDGNCLLCFSKISTKRSKHTNHLSRA